MSFPVHYRLSSGWMLCKTLTLLLIKIIITAMYNILEVLPALMLISLCYACVFAAPAFSSHCCKTSFQVNNRKICCQHNAFSHPSANRMIGRFVCSLENVCIYSKRKNIHVALEIFRGIGCQNICDVTCRAGTMQKNK